MAKRGRPKKSGKRTKSGRLSRAKPVEVIFDKGSQRTQDKFSVYGADGSDAIGRAYVMGLLGVDSSGQPTSEALELRNLARKIHRAYWPMLAVGREKSCLGLDINGQAVNDNLLDPEERERKIAREKRLTETLRAIAKLGAGHRRAFDELCIDINPDQGPHWLEGLIWDRRRVNRGAPSVADPAHRQALHRAVEALESVANRW